MYLDVRRLLAGTVATLVMASTLVLANHQHASATPFTHSSRVALVPDQYGRENHGGTLPTSGFPDGYAPTFGTVTAETIRDGADDPLSQYDTVVLNSICDIASFLSNAVFKSRVQGFVTNGGKLIIWDSECQSTDYSAFARPFTTSNPGAAGAQGALQDVEENTLSSSDPNSPHYLNVAAIASGTDAVGDSNVFTTYDDRWFVDLRATNVLGVAGPVQAYSQLGSGLVIYSGLDKDYMSDSAGFDAASFNGAAQLNRVWLLELLQPWSPDGLPQSTPATGLKDTDDDGLPDDWEEHGLRAEAGLILVNLPAMGADPKHKDVFVRFQAETNADLTKAAESIVVNAFRNAPVDNPDGKTGINLHVIRAGTLSFSGSDTMRSTASSGKVYPNFEKVHALLPVGWESVSHIALSVHWANTTWGGLSNGIPGQEFVLNMCGNSRDSHCIASDTAQAATFMHELGHNLGLHHGGDDDIRYKPNYFSIMNYTFEDPNLNHTTDTRLLWLTFRGTVGIPKIGVTYSSWGDETFYTLDEQSLSEPDGVKVKPGATFPADVKTYYYCQSNGSERPLPVNKPADWDCYKGAGTGRVTADINTPTSQRDIYRPADPPEHAKTALHPFDDWQYIQDHRSAFQGGNIGLRTVQPVLNNPIA
jgi:hypothetical protein